MSDAAFRDPAPVTRPAGPRHRRAATDAVATNRRWAVGVLTLATVGLAAYVTVLVAATWLGAAAWSVLTGHPAHLDLVAVARDAAPALLVGWCLGLATSAALSRGEALDPRLAGGAAGAVGTASGAAVLALTGGALL